MIMIMMVVVVAVATLQTSSGQVYMNNFSVLVSPSYCEGSTRNTRGGEVIVLLG